MRTGVFGGTFDPPHVGHLIVAQDAHAGLGLDRILFIPAREPPHKQGAARTDPQTRLAMVRAAIQGDDRFAASAIELHRSGPSYTSDTFRELKEKNPQDELFFLLGADQFREFGSWHEPEVIARLATAIVALSRGGIEPAEPGRADIPYRMLPVTRVDISSTEVRRRVAEGLPVHYLVPPGVSRFIQREGLYREPAHAEHGRG